jgi:hypothetical protein
VPSAVVAAAAIRPPRRSTPPGCSQAVTLGAPAWRGPVVLVLLVRRGGRTAASARRAVCRAGLGSRRGGASCSRRRLGAAEIVTHAVRAPSTPSRCEARDDVVAVSTVLFRRGTARARPAKTLSPALEKARGGAPDLLAVQSRRRGLGVQLPERRTR